MDALLNDTKEEKTLESAPLLFLYDCESSGGDILRDHVIEMAAKVVHCSREVKEQSYSSLVYTSRKISDIGEQY